MKGLIFDIKHCAIHDGPGLRTTVFFKGCPLNCWWCHNPESIFPLIQKIEVNKRIGNKSFIEIADVGQYMDSKSIMAEIEKDAVFYEESNGGITFSGGEPMSQIDFLTELAIHCKEKGFHTTLDTSGYCATENFEKILPYIDLFLYDIKTLDDIVHKKYTGKSNNLIINNLDYILSKNKQVIIRYPLIPGINTSIDQLSEIKKFLRPRSHEIHFLPYHNIGKNKYKQIGKDYKLNGLEILPENFLVQIKNDFEQDGFKVKIGG